MAVAAARVMDGAAKTNHKSAILELAPCMTAQTFKCVKVFSYVESVLDFFKDDFGPSAYDGFRFIIISALFGDVVVLSLTR